MPEINYKDLKKYLNSINGKFSPVYLIYGEEVLYKTAFNEILDAMLPLSERSMKYEPVESDNVYEAIELVNTFSLLPGTRVIALCDSRIFYSKQDETNILEKAKESYDGKDIKKAAKYLMSLFSVRKLSLEDVNNKANRENNLKLDTDLLHDGAWADEIIAYCTEKNLKIPASTDTTGDLQKAVEKGFPEGNHLLITTDIVDKRRELFNSVKTHGMIINCSIPMGNRKADKAEQDAVINERMKDILEQSGKSMDRTAYMAMYEMTGFDLRTFSSNLEKLVMYVGKKKNITIEDVNAILKRTKQDPIYELTNAIADRNIENSLFFLDSLLSAGYFPLQILAAIINQIRKILVIKGFTESQSGKVWKPGLAYPHFQSHVMSAVQEYDKMLINQLEEWENMISPDDDSEENGKKKKGKKKSNPVTDLIIAKNPGNAYPVYQMFLKSERFSKNALFDAVETLSNADIKLKSTGQNAKMILEKAIFRICRGNK